MVGRTELVVLSFILMFICSTMSSAAYVMMGGDGDKTPDPTPTPTPNPCTGLTDTSLASSVPVSCLRKLLTDEGCTSSGTVWPGDDYDDWWRQSPQGTTTVYCDDQGTPCGAGNYETVKRDIKFWATSTDPARVAGCGRAS
jgi:hypothetical protein